MGDFDQQIEAYANQLERQEERDAERAERKARAAIPLMTAAERERLAAVEQRRTTLELARARVLENLKTLGPGRSREQMEQSLAALEQEISALDG
jgi:hypothetical protein